MLKKLISKLFLILSLLCFSLVIINATHPQYNGGCWICGWGGCEHAVGDQVGATTCKVETIFCVLGNATCCSVPPY